MNTLAEIEVAVEALPPEQKEELLRYLASRLKPAETPRSKATLVEGPHGLLLEAPADAPSMTTETVKLMKW
jgi:hypothetical protein